MARRNEGWAFHVHHDTLVEYCTDYKGRVKYIKESKPKDEVALRLRLFKLIPLRYSPHQLEEATWKAYLKAREAYDWAWEAYNEARKACRPGFKELHERLCPDCPWNGETILGGII